MEYIVKNENGFSILETLVTITILGLLVSFTLTFFSRVYSNPALILKAEAFKLASDEIDNAVAGKVLRDTVYEKNENLIVKRNITDKGKYYQADVIVVFKSDKKELCSLSAAYKK